MPFVYSTMSNDVLYAALAVALPQDNIANRQAGVLIKGGANVINEKTLVTPSGVRTEVSEEQLEMLERDPVFKMHKENGFIVVDNVKKPADKKASEMERKDSSAQKTPAELKKEAEGARKKAEADGQ